MREYHESEHNLRVPRDISDIDRLGQVIVEGLDGDILIIDQDGVVEDSGYIQWD